MNSLIPACICFTDIVTAVPAENEKCQARAKLGVHSDYKIAPSESADIQKVQQEGCPHT